MTPGGGKGGRSMTGCSIDSRANVHFRFGGLNQPTKKGACPRVWEEAIQSNCRLSRNIRAISLSLLVHWGVLVCHAPVSW